MQAVNLSLLAGSGEDRWRNNGEEAELQEEVRMRRMKKEAECSLK